MITIYSMLPNVLSNILIAENLEVFAKQNSMPLILGISGQVACLLIIYNRYIYLLKSDKNC